MIKTVKIDIFLCYIFCCFVYVQDNRKHGCNNSWNVKYTKALGSDVQIFGPERPQSVYCHNCFKAPGIASALISLIFLSKEILCETLWFYYIILHPSALILLWGQCSAHHAAPQKLDVTASEFLFWSTTHSFLECLTATCNYFTFNQN